MTDGTTPDELPARLAIDVDGAFPELLGAYQDPLFSTVRRLVGNHHEAEDLTQEAFVRAYRALTGYTPERIRALALRAWLWTIALNLCRNRARSRSRKPPPGLLDTTVSVPDSVPGPESEALAAVAGDEWDRLLGRLPGPQRIGVVLRHIADLSYEDIAAATGRPTGTVKADVHRGLARLRTLLDQTEVMTS